VSAIYNSFEFRRHTVALAACAIIPIFYAALIASAAARPDEPPSDSVGVIDGESIRVTGPMSVEVVHGQVKTLLRSGTDVHVKTGSARIDLVEGGQISICGPAHLSVLKSGASLTVALDTGTVHVHIERTPALTIYTRQIQVQTVAIGDGAQDVLAGFEAPGAMCIRANRGAVRVEQQLTGQSVLIPQAGDVLLMDGQLENLRTSAGHCTCELQEAKAPEPQVGQPATAEELHKKAEAKEKNPGAVPNTAPAKEEPIYQVFMPPLIYDAKAKVQPEPDMRTIILVRRVRVRPTLIFQGRVEGDSVASVAPKPPASPRKPHPRALRRPRFPQAIPSSIVFATSSANCGRVVPDRNLHRPFVN
jgi:hypothetical protein